MEAARFIVEPVVIKFPLVYLNLRGLSAEAIGFPKLKSFVALN
jgi:hypothetical protein